MTDSKPTRTNWTSITEVNRQIDRAAEMHGRDAMRSFRKFAETMVNFANGPLESPLEAIFWIWWYAYTYGAHDGSLPAQLRLECQREVVCGGQTYRLDFVVGLDDELAPKSDLPFPLIAVEVDGHEFHEKTPEQVALRNTRDRALQLDGWLVFHFSWSEMIGNGEACVGQVLDVAIAALIQRHRAPVVRPVDGPNSDG